MPAVDVSGFTFSQALTIVLIAFCLKVASDRISVRDSRKRLMGDIEIIERLSALDLGDKEREMLVSFRTKTIQELPIKQKGTQGIGLKVSHIIIAAWFVASILASFYGATVGNIFALSLPFAVLLVTSHASYAVGVSDGTLRERENLITAKSLSYKGPEQVHDGKEDDCDA